MVICRIYVEKDEEILEKYFKYYIIENSIYMREVPSRESRKICSTFN